MFIKNTGPFLSYIYLTLVSGESLVHKVSLAIFFLFLFNETVKSIAVSTSLKTGGSQARWCTPLIPALLRQRQEFCEFETNLVCRASSRLAQAT